jgi:hypothetical protein
MEYSILAIRSAEEDDGRLYPIPGHEANQVQVEEWDGEPLRLLANRAQVSELVAGSWRTRQRVKDVKLAVMITDSRVVVCCSKFDKGGGWIGFGGAGAAVALAANGVSKARAAHRRRGKMLVGQVRYPWLRCVGFKPKTGWTSNEAIRLGVSVKSRDGAVHEIYLDLALPKNVDSAAVARAIVARAARYRLAHTGLDSDAHRSRFEELAEGPTLAAPEPKKFAIYQMPVYAFVNAGSAYPATAAQAG